LLERTVPFDRLDLGERRRLLREVLVEFFEADEVILEQGRTEHRFLYVVESGFVRLLDTETQRLADECGEGDVFGSHGLVRGGALPYEARAVEASVCMLVRGTHFRRLYEENEDFAAFFDSDLSRYGRERKAPLDASSARLLFGTRLGELVHREPLTCEPGATAQEAAQLMRREREDSVVVRSEGKTVGILSDEDLRNKLVAEAAPVDTPVERLMSPHVIRIRAAASVFEALMQMMGHRANHVVVTDGEGEGAALLGVVTDQDIARTQASSPSFIIERIEKAGTVAELARARSDATGLLVNLDRQGVVAEDLISINTETNDRLMRRTLELVEAELRVDPPVPPADTPWAWMSLGSEGRGEMGILTDQDNALVYADPATPEEAERAERWLGALAERANIALAEVGFALCKGDIMARNPKWRRPLSGWTETFRRWILEPEAHALLEAGIFFDLRGLHGDMTLVSKLEAEIAGALREQRGFLPLLAANALTSRPPPSSLLRRLVAGLSGGGRDAFDVKRRGLRPLVDVARVFAMQLRYLDSANTTDRLQHATRALPEMARAAENALEAYRYLSQLRFSRHLRAVERGEMPDNNVGISTLNETQQNMLRAVFSTVAEVQNAVAHRYGVDLKA
jgi:CBS domain-containing protein